jgi:hypothetical protein
MDAPLGSLGALGDGRQLDPGDGRHRISRHTFVANFLGDHSKGITGAGRPAAGCAKPDPRRAEQIQVSSRRTLPKNPTQTPVPNGKLRHFKGSTASGVIDRDVTHPAVVRLAGGSKI